MDEITCPNCEASRPDESKSRYLTTADGTSIMERQFECGRCGWGFIVNSVVHTPDEPA